MQAKLANKDLELAKAQQNLALLQNEVVELRRFSKRDGINMDYLKNIVIQVSTVYFSFFLICACCKKSIVTSGIQFFSIFMLYIASLTNHITIFTIFQYMTFPAQSSEKLSLVPVLATLLQFTPKELSSVQRCAVMEPVQTSLWSSMGLGGGSSVLSSKVPKEVRAKITFYM